MKDANTNLVIVALDQSVALVVHLVGRGLEGVCGWLPAAA
jgi:hypothetical protein